MRIRNHIGKKPVNRDKIQGAVCGLEFSFCLRPTVRFICIKWIVKDRKRNSRHERFLIIHRIYGTSLSNKRQSRSAENAKSNRWNKRIDKEREEREEERCRFSFVSISHAIYNNSGMTFLCAFARERLNSFHPSIDETGTLWLSNIY